MFKRASKSIAAQHVIDLIEQRFVDRTLDVTTLRGVLPEYVIHAIEYATSGSAIPAAASTVSAILAGVVADPGSPAPVEEGNRRVDLINEGIDVALRVRETGDEEPNLVTRRLREAHTEVVASPIFAKTNNLSHPKELTTLPFLGALDSDRLARTRLHNSKGERFELAMPARLGVEDFEMRKEAALAGLGFTVLPMMYCEDELASGALVRLLPDWHCPPAWLQAAYPHRRGVLPAIRAWLDHLEQAFNKCGNRSL